LEPCGVLPVSVAVQEVLDGLCDVVFQFGRSASVATRSGRPILPGWAPQAGRRAFQAPRAPAGCWGRALLCWHCVRAGPLGVRGARLVVGVPIGAWEQI